MKSLYVHARVSMYVQQCRRRNPVCLASFEQNMCIVLHFTSIAIKKKDVCDTLLHCF